MFKDRVVKRGGPRGSNTLRQAVTLAHPGEPKGNCPIQPGGSGGKPGRSWVRTNLPNDEPRPPYAEEKPPCAHAKRWKVGYQRRRVSPAKQA